MEGNTADVTEDAESLVRKLDHWEKKVENFRLKAQELERERENLLKDLQKFQLQSISSLNISPEDQEDLEANTDRLIYRCLTVDITVFTQRTNNQEKMLFEIQGIIDDLDKRLLKDAGTNAQRLLLPYLNACLSDEVSGFIDQRFQTKLLQCAADDQKRIRKMLESRAKDYSLTTYSATAEETKSCTEEDSSQASVIILSQSSESSGQSDHIELDSSSS